MLFQIQPMIARHILPWFGGSPAVWTSCMLFFQVFLLGGYYYAHVLARLLTPAKQVKLHLTLLVLSMLILPITPNEVFKPDGSDLPLFNILLLLSVTVGFPYLMISASGPLLQHWFALANPGRSPYRLYSLSNTGSLLGLLTYPFLIEPTMTLTTQSWAWSGGFVLYVAFVVRAALPLLKIDTPDEVDDAHVSASSGQNCSGLVLPPAARSCCSPLPIRFVRTSRLFRSYG